MLQELIDLLETTNQLSQEQICESMGITQESLKSMLDILVSKGRLHTKPLQVAEDCTTLCHGCPLGQSCSVNDQETFYYVVPKGVSI